MNWKLSSGPNGSYYTSATGEEVWVKRSKATWSAARAIMSAAKYCPSIADHEGFRAYQDEVMQPLRDKLRACVEQDRAATRATLPAELKAAA